MGGVVKAVDAFKTWLSETLCRKGCDHFGETAVWGERCGTATTASDAPADSASKRDFTDEALCLLCAARALVLDHRRRAS